MYEEKTKRFLEYFGVGDSYQGFHFCAYSMKLATEHPEWLRNVTKSIYPEVAKKFKTSCGCVERNIRTVIEIIWQRGGKEYFKSMTVSHISEQRPSNSKFLCLLADYVLSENEINPESDGSLPADCKNSCDYKQKIIILNKENRELRNTVNEMHNIIGKLIEERDEYQKLVEEKKE